MKYRNELILDKACDSFMNTSNTGTNIATLTNFLYVLGKFKYVPQVFSADGK